MQMANRQLSVRLLLLLAAICVVFLLIGGSADAEIPTQEPVEYVVESGDTLWAIAASTAGPETDVRRLVSDIAQLSGLDDHSIFPGQILLLPAG
jgi:nucleoid-associated protein YgaU